MILLKSITRIKIEHCLRTKNASIRGTRGHLCRLEFFPRIATSTLFFYADATRNIGRPLSYRDLSKVKRLFHLTRRCFRLSGFEVFDIERNHL